MEKSMGEMRLSDSTSIGNDEEKWGLAMRDLYRLALSFYKDKSGKAVHISYEDNLKLVAFTQQAIHGSLDPNTAPPVGVLDVIGRDRRMAWQSLGVITKTQAMEGFIDLLDRLCPSFKTYVEAIKRDREEQQKVHEIETRRQNEVIERERVKVEEQQRIEEVQNREEMQKRDLQYALNQQTFHQFKAYAEKQFPGNPDQQAVLIRQLQNEHYHQYMQQLQAQLQIPASMGQVGGDVAVGTEIEARKDEAGESDSESDDVVVIERANMWTRSDLEAFKVEVSAGKGDGVLRVGHGDTVTVRVPTHEGGSCLYWEFATDNHDIGFGVYFEWGKPQTTEVSVHISESDDEEDPGEEGDEIESYSDLGGADDLESGALQAIIPQSYRNRPATSIIVPIYRRDCQKEIYAGSHVYPGEGVYLLKFDNSYSLWRSKTLYYRVFYTR